MGFSMCIESGLISAILIAIPTGSNIKIRGNVINIGVEATNSTFIGNYISITQAPPTVGPKVSGAAISGDFIRIQRSFIGADITSTNDCPGDPNNPNAPTENGGVYIDDADVFAPISGCYVRVTVSCNQTQHNVINAMISGYNLWVQNYTLNSPYVGNNLLPLRNFAASCKGIKEKN